MEEPDVIDGRSNQMQVMEDQTKRKWWKNQMQVMEEPDASDLLTM